MQKIETIQQAMEMTMVGVTMIDKKRNVDTTNKCGRFSRNDSKKKWNWAGRLIRGKERWLY